MPAATKRRDDSFSRTGRPFAGLCTLARARFTERFWAISEAAPLWPVGCGIAAIASYGLRSSSAPGASSNCDPCGVRRSVCSCARGVMAGLNRRTDAVLLLARAEEILREQQLLMLAAAVSRRRGELEGEKGSGRIQAADAFMKSENILRPDRMTAM